MKKTGQCLHFNGIQNKKCRIGLPMTENQPGIPCIKKFSKDHYCEKYEEPSESDIKESQAEWDEVMNKLMIVMPLAEELKAYHKNHGGSGSRECPVCKGKIYYSVASSNNHIHMKCETDNCIKFME